MLFVLDLIRNNRMLGRNHICSMTDEQNLRQLIGLYRLMVRSRDYKTFQLLVIYARKNINPVLFVNALTLALADRLDTQMLIVPALYEILPRSYTDVSLIRTVENVGAEDAIVNRNIGSIRPNIFDIIERGRETRLARLRSLENGYYGGIIDKSQLWMPWRDMHRQLALQKSLGGRVFIYDQGKQDVSVHLVSLGDSSNDQHQGLIAKDIGLRAFLNILLDELIVEQGNFLDYSTHQQSVHTSNIEYNTGNDLGRDDINDDIDISVRPSNQQNVEQDHVMNTDNKGKGMVNVIKTGGILVADGLKDLIGIAKSRIQNAKDHTVPHHTSQDGSLNNDLNIEPYKLQDGIKPINTRDQDMSTNTVSSK